jgi:hypothetical protein
MKKSVKYKKYYRMPRTYNEMRQNERDSEFVAIRGKRKYKSLVTAWDDISTQMERGGSFTLKIRGNMGEVGLGNRICLASGKTTRITEGCWMTELLEPPKNFMDGWKIVILPPSTTKCTTKPFKVWKMRDE